MARLKRRSQPRVEGGRDALPSCVLREIYNHVDATAKQFSVSRSWVIATILADYYGITEQVSFRTGSKK